MEQLPLTFVQSTVEPDIQECYEPSFNFSKVNSSLGRLAFTADKIYWLPDAPMALLDQGWVIHVSEVASCGKYGLAGFVIKLKDGKELRFANVGGKMRDSITEAIESRKATAGEAPAAPTAEAPAAEAEPVSPTEAITGSAPDPDFTPEDARSNKLMAVLAYLGVLVLIPLFAAKESKFARFHTNQGLILLIFNVVSIVFSRLGWGTLSWILNVVIFILAIIGIINAVKGEAKELPVVGKYRILS